MIKDIIIKKSKINKNGVFAKRDFKKGEIVLKWNPKVLNESQIKDLEENQKRYLRREGKDKYFLMQPPERFVNHSCDANTQVENDCDVATRNIKKGEEITSDYKQGSSVLFECNCGSENCRDRVGY